MLLGLVEVCAQRLFRNPLHVGIDRGANAESFVHGAVPADGFDDFLPDVIDRVSLPLGALAIANCDLFIGRAGVTFGANESEVAHSCQHYVARIACAGFVGPG